MPLSSESYRRLAADLGYQQDTLEKVLRLGELLDQIGRHDLLGGALTLRGGTALNLLQGSPPRLSVDVDFDYIGTIEREGMLAAKPEVIASVDRIARALNYQVVLPRQEHAGSTIRLRFQNSRGTQDEVKVDISWTNRVQVAAPSRRALWQPEAIARPSALVSSHLDLAADKFRALIDRVAARDVFDGVEIAKRHVDWPREVRSAFVFLSGTLDRPLTTYGPERIDTLSVRQAERNLGPMIRGGESLDVEKLIEDAKQFLSPLLNLTAAEREFVERLHQGELAPELLFEVEVADRLRHHPHLLWKVQNVREHLKR